MEFFEVLNYFVLGASFSDFEVPGVGKFILSGPIGNLSSSNSEVIFPFLSVASARFPMICHENFVFDFPFFIKVKRLFYLVRCMHIDMQ